MPTNDASTPNAGQEFRPTEIARRRALLAEAGYLPIPAKDKSTYVNGCTDVAVVTADLIAQWARDHADHISDGLLTKRTPGLDADITNQAASEAVEAMVRERFGGRGRKIFKSMARAR